MYRRIFVALDGSVCSHLAIGAAVSLAENFPGCELVGCHVYAAEMHRTRFAQMEPGLPERYQEEERLQSLRGTHESLITDGMQLISDSYLAPLVKAAQKRGVPCSGLAPEGRNYVRLLQAIRSVQPDLVVMGAWGHGRTPESLLGSLTERVLLSNLGVDLLIMRRPFGFKGQPILAGVDGSPESYAALLRAIRIGRSYQAAVEGAAVYDPFFHLGVFSAIADVLPEKDQQRFNFPAQEKLHDEIIDRGLEKLYQEGLDRGRLLALQEGLELKTSVLAGKVYPQLHHFAQLRNAGLVCVGQFGLHREPGSWVGSNTLNLARLSQTNLLVVTSPDQPVNPPALPESENSVTIEWTAEAEERLERIPPFVRKMARRAIEERARQQGLREVTAEIVLSMSKRMGRS